MSGCVRKETIDMITIVASRNGDRKIMQLIRIMSGPPKRMWNEFSQFIYQSNTCRKDLGWLYSDDEPRVQEKLQASNNPATDLPKIFKK